MLGKMQKIIDNTPESKRDWHKGGWGGDEIEITMEHINALLEGKCFAFNDGEYTHVIYLNKYKEALAK